MTLYLQGGQVTFNSLSGNDCGATIVFHDVDLSTDADSFNDPLDATLQGTGGLDKYGTQTLTLNADGSGYSGPVTISGGAIGLGIANALYNSSVIVGPDRGLLMGGLPAATIGALGGSGAIDLGSTNLTVGGNDADTTYSGDFSGALGSSITKVGVTNNLGSGVFSGVWTLSGDNSGYFGQITIDAGTIEIGSANALFGSTVNVIAGLGNGLTSVTANGGTLAATTLGGLTGNGNVNMGTTNLTVGQDGDTTTFSGTLSGSGTFNKVGLGKLTLTATNGGAAATTISAGIPAVPLDGDLPGGTVTINVSSAVLSELEYTGTSSTSRSFVLDGGTIKVDAGQTLSLTGSTVTGTDHDGYLDGPGAFATVRDSNGLGGSVFTYIIARPSVTINSTVLDDRFIHFDNGAVLNVNSANTADVHTFDDFLNEGAGTVTIGAGSQVEADGFHSYGVLNLDPATAAGTVTMFTNVGTSILDFNNGSRTFISTIAQAALGNYAAADLELNGQNAVVLDALFVDNGKVTDNSALGIATIISDMGSLVKGAGQYDNSPQTRNGGRFQGGNCPGDVSVGDFVIGPDGVSNYTFEIDDATGTAGPTPDANNHLDGNSLVDTVNLAWNATPDNPVTINLETLLNPSTPGTEERRRDGQFRPDAKL